MKTEQQQPPKHSPEETFKGKGVFAQPGMEPPLNALFEQLRDIWRAEEPGRTYTELADKVGVPTQNISQWATGSDGRRPPWHVIMWLCEETRYELVGGPNRWQLVKVGGDAE